MIPETVKTQFRQVMTDDRVMDGPEVLAAYSYDAYFEEAMPDLVLLPKTTKEVSRIMEICSGHGIPVTARGAGSSVCGASIPARGGVVLCFSRMAEILEINTRDRYAVVQPGVVNNDLQSALAPFGFFYPPDPGSMMTATIGGNVAQNAGGPRCLKYGVTADYVMGMEVVLASGKVIRFGSRNIKDVTGYRFSGLFCGSEGTLGLVTEVILRVVPRPEAVRTLLVTFDDLEHTAQSVSDIIGAGILPAALELMDRVTVNMIEDAAGIGLPREAAGTLIIEIDGVEEACEKEMQQVKEKLKDNHAMDIRTAASETERAALWQARRSAYGVFAKMAPDIFSEDVTVPPSRLPEMIRKTGEIGGRYGFKVGILAHAGDGNMHPMIPTDKRNKEEWARVEKVFDEIVEAAVALGGTLSGEHGIGLAKTGFLPLVMDEDTRQFMSDIKKAVDPEGILNPGKFV